MDLPSSWQVELNRDEFLATLIRELSQSLEHIVGLDDARGFISLVGNRIGNNINDQYRNALRAPRLSAEQVAAVLVDLKQRVGGGFYVIELTADRLLLGNTKCPFGSHVVGHTSMCMMTSSVFGVISAQNLGYANVVLEETIAKGDAGCRVAIYFEVQDEVVAESREYFRVEPDL